jgi:hypothetical protein
MIASLKYSIKPGMNLIARCTAGSRHHIRRDRLSANARASRLSGFSFTVYPPSNAWLKFGL